MPDEQPAPRVAIACGGTGGHLFPGLAVAEELLHHGCAVTLLISPKDVDQQAVKSASGVKIVTLPAVGLSKGSRLAFVRGFWESYCAARALFKVEQPEAVLAMGGFTSAPPVLAGKFTGARVFLHESNTIPGRANRWLSWVIHQAFVGFGEASPRLHARSAKITGTPVRTEFKQADAATCRQELGLDPQRPVLLVTGGSQGASALNQLVIDALPLLAKKLPELQLFHLAGPSDAGKVEEAARAAGIKATVHPFFAKMHLALGAASVTVSRAGASSLAELAAMRVPAILIPYPAATDNHQQHNALAFEKTGAAFLLEQERATPELLVSKMNELVRNNGNAANMREALEKWHAPHAAEQIAESMMRLIIARRRDGGRAAATTATKIQHQSVRT
ncbi:MAG TPA: undecaprenyldiphospho-muramoylpentapeptide beta-N-acetylglucosaminyltransferase [Verrucomicrobiae bacterium]|jgi:UDP-N-acetylglucosamine--N-acetylmuramyl-(pentapeptide) pyrophosphoryl-undecaprenol N-acetylglucosamine transferase|nr:undecaprenyldiphospho-muramoylpentapeptide beta-N-acetylglucosaminyltransferase [Verrucomicrobiae bacterium]